MSLAASRSPQPVHVDPDALLLKGEPVYVYYAKNMEWWAVADLKGFTIWDGFRYEEDAIAWIEEKNADEDWLPIQLAAVSPECPK